MLGRDIQSFKISTLESIEVRLRKFKLKQNHLRVVLKKTRSISYGNLAKFGRASFYDLLGCLVVLAVYGRFFDVKVALIILAGSRDFWYSSLKCRPVSAIPNAW